MNYQTILPFTASSHSGQSSIPSDYVAFYKLEDNSGFDETGNNHITYSDPNVIYSAGKFEGFGASLSNGAYLETPLTVPSSAFTWSVWAKFESAGSDTGGLDTIFGRWLSAGAESYGYAIFLEETGTAHAGVWADVDGVCTFISSSASFSYDSNWHHLVFRYDGSEIVLFMDGVKYAAALWDGQLNGDAEKPLWIGKGNSDPASQHSQIFEGTVDHIRVYERALSDSEVNTLYNENENNGAIINDGILTNDGSAADDRFTVESHIDGDRTGVEVDISRDGMVMVVGAWFRNSERGGFYLYERDITTGGWSLIDFFCPPSAVSGDKLGYSLRISGDGHTVVLGGYNQVEEAYVYSDRSGSWILEATLTASEISCWNPNGFGFSVAVDYDGDTVAVGSYGCNGVGIFKRSESTWTKTRVFGGAINWFSSNFGYSVAISDDGLRLAVADFYKNTSERGVVGVYELTEDGCISYSPDLLTYRSGDIDSRMGIFVDISSDGRFVLAGAYYDNGSGTRRGAVYHFYEEGYKGSGSWSSPTKATSPTPFDYEYFGRKARWVEDGSLKFIVCSYGGADYPGKLYLYEYPDTFLQEYLPDVTKNDTFWGYGMVSNGDILVASGQNGIIHTYY